MASHRKLVPGITIEHLELLENLGLRLYCGKNTSYWKCRCTRCGNIIEVPQKNLGKTQKDCGCGRKLPRKEIGVGTKFGRLTVVKLGELIPGRGYTYLCECSCDKHTQIYVRGDLLRSGEVKSCGCIHDELLRENVQKAYKNNFVGGTSVSKIITDKLQRNNTSGIRGVSWHKGQEKWQARIMYKGITYYLGYYSDIKDAEKVIKTAREYIKKDFVDWYSQEYPEQWKKKCEKKLFHN